MPEHQDKEAYFEATITVRLWTWTLNEAMRTADQLTAELIGKQTRLGEGVCVRHEFIGLSIRDRRH